MPYLCGRRLLARARTASVGKVMWVSRKDAKWPEFSPRKREAPAVHGLFTVPTWKTLALSPLLLRAGVIRGVSLLWQPFGAYHVSRHRSTAPNSPDLNPRPDLTCMWITRGPGKRRFWFGWSGVGCEVTAFLMSCQMMPWTKLWVPRYCRTIQGNLYLGFCTLRFLPHPRLPIQLWSQPIYPS